MPKIQHHSTTKEKRQKRVRGKMFGTAQKPRLSVYRSNQHIYLQAIDDEQGQTIAAANDLGTDNEKEGTKIERAELAAQEIAKLLKKKKIKQVVFDRGHYRYHGRVKAVAEALRAAGLNL